MEFVHISREVEITLEGNKKLRFLKNSINSPIILTEEQLQKKILGIEFSYCFDNNQDSSIQSLRDEFNAKRDGIIRKIPNSFEKHVIEDVIMLKYGHAKFVNPSLLGLAEKVGVAVYWNKANIVICCAKKYEQIAKHIEELISCNKARFEIRMDEWGPNLRIVSIV